MGLWLFFNRSMKDSSTNESKNDLSKLPKAFRLLRIHKKKLWVTFLWKLRDHSLYLSSVTWFCEVGPWSVVWTHLIVKLLMYIFYLIEGEIFKIGGPRLCLILQCELLIPRRSSKKCQVLLNNRRWHPGTSVSDRVCVLHREQNHCLVPTTPPCGLSGLLCRIWANTRAL